MKLNNVKCALSILKNIRSHAERTGGTESSVKELDKAIEMLETSLASGESDIIEKKSVLTQILSGLGKISTFSDLIAEIMDKLM